MRKTILLAIVALMIFSSVVAAQELSMENYVANVDIRENFVEQTISFTIANDGDKTLSTLSYFVQTLPENVIVSKKSIITVDEIVDSRVEKSTQGYEIVIDLPIESHSKTTLTIGFTTDGLVTRTDDKNLFRFFYSPEAKVENFKLRTSLPEGSKLTLLEGIPVISPQPYTLGTDGEKIFIEWTKSELEKAESFSAIIQYQSTQTQFPTTILAILAGVIGGLIGYRLKVYRKMKFIKTVLSEDESATVKHIEKAGELLQDKLPQLTGFSKTKISKIVRVLEQRGVVQKIPYRKTNKLKVKK